MFLSESGQIYGGDRQRRSDGTLDPELPPRPGPQYQWDGSAWVFAHSPQWTELGKEFRNPGRPLYTSVYAKIRDAERGQIGSLTPLLGLQSMTATQAKTWAAGNVRDHWNNFKALLMSQDLRDVEPLRQGIFHLANLLKDAGYPLSVDDVTGWNALINTYGFPPSCKLPV